MTTETVRFWHEVKIVEVWNDVECPRVGDTVTIDDLDYHVSAVRWWRRGRRAEVIVSDPRPTHGGARP